MAVPACIFGARSAALWLVCPKWDRPRHGPVRVARFGALTTAGTQISMDGRGRWMDDAFVERLWRSLKHEGFHLKGYAGGIAAAKAAGMMDNAGLLAICPRQR